MGIYMYIYNLCAADKERHVEKVEDFVIKVYEKSLRTYLDKLKFTLSFI